jgi:hypothetical protein
VFENTNQLCKFTRRRSSVRDRSVPYRDNDIRGGLPGFSFCDANCDVAGVIARSSLQVLPGAIEALCVLRPAEGGNNG